ncbi:MAG: c-type cytochrome [Salibacteraceae bacterium]
MKNIIGIIAVGLIIVACNATKLAAPSQVDLDRISTTYPDYTLADMTAGKTLYENHCGSCHKLIQPTDKTAEEWKNIVPPMVEKVNKNGKVLDAEKHDLIVKYVTGMCSANPPM